MSEITIINPNDLRTIVSDVVEEKLIAFANWFEAKLIQEERPLTAKEAMKYLSMSRATFYRYVDKGVIPKRMLDTKVYYYKSDLDNAILKVN
ncbi:helix-turn-helix domain-containing protein [Flavobacteriaceae bacterium AU392]|nr:DNA-binding protein [Flavobacteriaceae bacterium]RKM86525.1 helix-turn-helix domain-containing protein [Flavobacteriaceae bacterium AU392]